jgi:hypothetical protein
MGPRITTLCRTVKFVLDTATFGYFNLTAGECLRAENAKPAVIERAPTAKLIHGTQDRQSIVGLEMVFHGGAIDTLEDSMEPDNRIIS